MGFDCSVRASVSGRLTATVKGYEPRASDITMTRRRFFAPPEAFSPDLTGATLNAEETRHLRNVLRLAVGDAAFVFDGQGREFQGRVQMIGRDSSHIEIVNEVAPASPESPLNLTLAVAILKGEKFDLVIQKATELGVAQIVPVLTARADVKIPNQDDGKRKTNRWQRIALEATKQCGRARLLTIETPITFEALVRSSAVAGLRLMFGERTGDSLGTAVGDERATIATALIGPEGGWEADEIEQARAAGWEIITLGGRILRAETAAIAIAALLQNRWGDLK